MNDGDQALFSYERALTHNPYNLKALHQVGVLYKSKETFSKVEHWVPLSANISDFNSTVLVYFLSGGGVLPEITQHQQHKW